MLHAAISVLRRAHLFALSSLWTLTAEETSSAPLEGKVCSLWTLNNLETESLQRLNSQSFMRWLWDRRAVSSSIASCIIGFNRAIKPPPLRTDFSSAAQLYIPSRSCDIDVSLSLTAGTCSSIRRRWRRRTCGVADASGWCLWEKRQRSRITAEGKR